MTERLVRPALAAILDAIEGIENATHGKTLADYGNEWLLRHGVQRGIEIISEATRRIPVDVQATRPEIPWAQIAAIGNILRHEYHRVADSIVWNVVEQHLPPLKIAIVAIASALKEC